MPDCTFGLSNVFLNIAALSKKCEFAAFSEATHTFFVLSILVTNISSQVNLKKKASSTQKKSSKLSLVCIATVVTFVLLTLPYAITRILTGQVPFWTNVILGTNSWINSVVYFLRSKISKIFAGKDGEIFWTKTSNPSIATSTSIIINNKNWQKYKILKYSHIP